MLVRGGTRGNGLVGEDVTANVQAIKSIPQRLPAASGTYSDHDGPAEKRSSVCVSYLYRFAFPHLSRLA